jgi:hypothetical protein
MGRFARDVRVLADTTQQRTPQRAVRHKIPDHGATAETSARPRP